MAFHDDLLELAQDLANLHPEDPHQASLRRAVSTAYYALFHLLISEATANWARPERFHAGIVFVQQQRYSTCEAKFTFRVRYENIERGELPR